MPEPATPEEIIEAVFHRALTAATGLTSTAAGDTFAVPAPEWTLAFVRVNDRHFRLRIPATAHHAEILRLLGRSSIWSRPARTFPGEGRP